MLLMTVAGTPLCKAKYPALNSCRPLRGGVGRVRVQWQQLWRGPYQCVVGEDRADGGGDGAEVGGDMGRGDGMAALAYLRWRRSPCS